MTDALVVLCTVPSAEVAEKIAHAVVGEQLAACVNVVPGLRSIYAWKGEIADDQELLCVIKTRRERFDALRARILELHPYEVAEVIALPVEAGNPPYLQWIQAETKET
jgi:periplasmic divalent cation tolerance protein